MVKVALPERRSTVEDERDCLKIVIPAKRNWWLLIFLGAWLVGWAFGWVAAVYSLLTGQAKDGIVFISAWLVAWTVGGAFVIYTWLWGVCGREIVLLSYDTLTVRREILGFGRSREYSLASVKHLRVERPTISMYEWGASAHFWGLRGGSLAFDYGAQTFHFGVGIDGAEAALIVMDLQKRHSFGDRAA